MANKATTREFLVIEDNTIVVDLVLETMETQDLMDYFLENEMFNESLIIVEKPQRTDPICRIEHF